MNKTNAGIELDIAKGWKPNQYLTNMSMAYFQAMDDFAAKKMFPICPVGLSTGYYYTFDKGDLARDNVKRKPAFGKVAPALMGQSDNTYKCFVDQVIVGIDQIGQLNYQRAGAPGVSDPRKAKIRFATEQMNLHMDILFAQKYFAAGVWTNEWAGVTATPTGKQFLKFSDSNFDPVLFFDNRKREIKEAGRRTPNELGLGYDAFLALKNHGDIIDRVKYNGNNGRPAIVSVQALAEILGFEDVVVFQSSYNKAGVGEAADMSFICDSKSALMVYATPTPAIDEPSAGYTFAWDMLGNGNYTAFDQYEGEKGTHSEFVEGLCSTDMEKTADDLGTFMKDCI